MELSNYKKAAVEFLEMVVSGNVDAAYERYVNMNGRHHNPFNPTGFLALREAMKENHLKFPHKQFTIKNVIGDGDLVAIHSCLKFEPATADSMSVVHIFRFEEGRIVEFWDCGQTIPADSSNIDGAF